MNDEHSSPALQVALAYYHAWTSKDLERAMSYIDDGSSATRLPVGSKAPPRTASSWARSSAS